MKNKKLSWILVPGVLAIWAAIAWQVYNTMKDDDSFQQEKQVAVVPLNASSLSPDTFTLLLDYRDPFLDGLVKKKPAPVANTEHHAAASKKNAPLPEESPWPSIKYSGLVRQPNTDRMVGFLTIDGATHFVKSGDVVGVIQVGKVWKDSIQVSFGKASQVVKK